MPRKSNKRQKSKRGRVSYGAPGPLAVRPSLKTHTFRRTSVFHFYVAASATTTAYANTNDSWYFNLSNGMISSIGKFIDSGPGTTSTVAYSAIPSYTEFTALFDQYRIKSVRVHLMPAITQSVAAASPPPLPVMVYSTNDYNTTGAYADLATLLQREDARSVVLDKPIDIQYRPRPIVGSLSNGTLAGNVQLGDDDPYWISTSDASVYGTGIQVAFMTASTQGSYLVVGICCFDLEFRTVS